MFRNDSGDYRRKYVIMAILIVAFVVYGLFRASHSVTVSNSTGSQIRVSANSARQGDGGVEYLTLADGQKIAIRADLTSGSLLVEVFLIHEDESTEEVFNGTFSAGDADAVDVAAGDYAVRVTAEAGTDGSMTVQAE